MIEPDLTRQDEDAVNSCDESFGDACSKLNCKNCPYCQARGKIMCRECSKCTELAEPSVEMVSGESVTINFGGLVIPDILNFPAVQKLEIGNAEFLDAIGATLDGSDEPMRHIPASEFSDKFSSIFGELSFRNSPKHTMLYCTERGIKTIQVLDREIHLAELPTDAASFSDYLAQYKSAKADPSSDSGPRLPRTSGDEAAEPQITCNVRHVYKVSITPENIKAGLSNYLERDIDVLIVTRGDCADTPFSLGDLVPEISYSLILVLVSSYLRDVLFSFLNNKKLLDIVQFDPVPKFESFEQLKGFFKSTSCFLIRKVHAPDRPFESNSAIKKLFIPDYGSRFEGSVLHAAQYDFWESETTRQYDLKFPSVMIARYQCRHHFTVPEYFAIVSFVLLVLSGAVMYCVLLIRTTKHVAFVYRLKRRAVRLVGLVHRVFLRVLLLIYYYNVIQFFTMITQVKSLFFTGYDFAIVTVRSALMLYPLLTMVQSLSPDDPIVPDQEDQVVPKRPERSKAVSSEIDMQYRGYSVQGFWLRFKLHVLVFFRVRKTGPVRNRQSIRRLSKVQNKLIKARLRVTHPAPKPAQRPIGTYSRGLTPDNSPVWAKLFTYVKNISFFMVLFCFGSDPIRNFVLVVLIQGYFAHALVISLDLSKRSFWVPVMHEIFLTVYYIVYINHQKAHLKGDQESFLGMFYFFGLSIAVIGLCFDTIDQKKLNYIPKSLWNRQQ